MQVRPYSAEQLDNLLPNFNRTVDELSTSLSEGKRPKKTLAFKLLREVRFLEVRLALLKPLFEPIVAGPDDPKCPHCGHDEFGDCQNGFVCYRCSKEFK